MKPTRRLLALYVDYLACTVDEGLPALSLGGLLGQLTRAGERGVGDRPLAYAWGVQVELVRELRGAVGCAAAPRPCGLTGGAIGTPTSEPRRVTAAGPGTWESPAQRAAG